MLLFSLLLFTYWSRLPSAGSDYIWLQQKTGLAQQYKPIIGPNAILMGTSGKSAKTGEVQLHGITAPADVSTALTAESTFIGHNALIIVASTT